MHLNPMTTKPSSENLLIEHIKAWGDLYGRRLGVEAAQRWFEIFSNVPPAILEEALVKVTAECERFPTPGHLSKAIAVVREKYPVPLHSVNMGPLMRDAKGTRCHKDLSTGELLYRANDCKEGRLFLLKLAELSGKSKGETLKLWQKWTDGS
jgi:hypothetical protein